MQFSTYFVKRHCVRLFAVSFLRFILLHCTREACPRTIAANQYSNSNRISHYFFIHYFSSPLCVSVFVFFSLSAPEMHGIMTWHVKQFSRPLLTLRNCGRLSAIRLGFAFNTFSMHCDSIACYILLLLLLSCRSFAAICEDSRHTLARSHNFILRAVN